MNHEPPGPLGRHRASRANRVVHGALLAALALVPGACTKSSENTSETPRSNATSTDHDTPATGDTPTVTDTTDPGHTEPKGPAGGATGKNMHRHNVFSAATSSAGDRLVTSSTNGEVIVWQTDPLRALHTLEPAAGTSRGKTRALALSADGKTAYIGVESRGQVERWKVADGKAMPALDGFTGRITALAYHASGDTLAAAGADRAAGGGSGGDGIDDEVPALQAPVVRVWRGDSRPVELAGLKGTVSALAFNGDGSAVAAGGEGSIMVWNARTGARMAEHEIPGQVATVAFVDGHPCAISSKMGRCAHPDGTIDWSGVKAPTGAAYIDGTWVVNGTYESLEVRRVDDPDKVVASIPERVYGIVPVGKDIWAIFKDRAVVIRDGKLAGTEHKLKQ